MQLLFFRRFLGILVLMISLFLLGGVTPNPPNAHRYSEAWARYLLCKKHMKRKAFKKAEHYCQMATTHEPKAYLLLAKVYLKQKQTQKAIRSYRVYLKKAKNHTLTFLELAKLYESLGMLRKAARNVERYLMKKPHDLKAANRLATLYTKLQAYKAAEKMLRGVLARNPKNVSAYRNLMVLYMAWRKYNQAELVATLAVSVLQLKKSKSVKFTYLQGVLYWKKGDLTKATYYFRKVLKRQPKNLQAQSHLGAISLRRGRWIHGLKHFRAILRAHPKQIYALRNVGVAFMALRRLKEARRTYQILLKLKPKDPEALFQLGVTYFQDKKLSEKLKARYFFSAFLAQPGAKKLNNFKVAKKYIHQAEKLFVKFATTRPATTKPHPAKKKALQKTIP